MKFLKNQFHRISRYCPPMLSGILIATSFIPFPPWALLFCMLPLWSFWLFSSKNKDGKVRLKSVFFAGWWCQFFITLIGFHWIIHTAHEFGAMPYYLATILLILFSCFANLHIPIAGLLWGVLQKRYQFSLKTNLFLLALFTSLGEIFYPMIFPWHLGYPWIKGNWQGFQWADIVGTHGISTMTFLFNAAIYYIWRNYKDKSLAKISPWPSTLTLSLGLTIIFFVFNFSGSKHAEHWRADNKNNTKNQQSFNILNVQANIGNIIKHFAEKGETQAIQHISSKYMNITNKAIQESTQPIDLIVWPETAFPYFLDPFYQKKFYPQSLFKYVKNTNIPFIVGAYSEEVGGKKDVYNAIFAIEPDGNILQKPYLKSILLAFGEYFPGTETFPQLKPLIEKFIPEVSHFGRGPGPNTMSFPDQNNTTSYSHLKSLTIGPQVCYEGLYPEFSRSLVNQGAQVFINITNDSWFASSFEPYQHLYMTSGRAIEFRKPLIRNTNTGISTVIQADGSFGELSPLRTEWGKVFTVHYTSEKHQTFFARYGQWFSRLLIFIIFIITLRAEIKLKKIVKES